MRLKTVKLISALLCLTLLAGCGNAVSQTEQGELTDHVMLNIDFVTPI